MTNSSETTGRIVIVLLAIAAIIANTLIPRLINDPVDGPFIITIFMILIAICGFLAARYKSTD